MIRRTQTAVSKEELKVSMIEGLKPVVPSPSFFVDEHSQRERDAEKDREKRCSGVTCNKKELVVKKDNRTGKNKSEGPRD